MPENSKSLSAALFPAVGLILTALASFTFIRPDLKLPAVPHAPNAIASGAGGDSVMSRLWEDPFPPGLVNSPNAARLQAPRNACLKGSALVVLPVLVKASPFPEDAEDRLRSRYAVVTALIKAGLDPVNREAVSLWRFKSQAGVPLYLKRPSEFVVPYEWFVARTERNASSDAGTDDLPDPQGRSVLVLWLDEQYVEPRIREVMAELKSSVDFQLPPNHRPAHASLQLLGPNNSDTMDQLVRKDESIKDGLRGSGKPQVPPTTSPTTGQLFAPPAPLFDGPDRIWNYRATRALRRSTAVDVGRVNVPDDALCRRLVYELQLHRLNPTADHVALIHESDTLYGRSLPVEFLAAWQKPAAVPRPSAFAKLDDWLRQGWIGDAENKVGMLPLVPTPLPLLPSSTTAVGPDRHLSTRPATSPSLVALDAKPGGSCFDISYLRGLSGDPERASQPSGDDLSKPGDPAQSLASDYGKGVRPDGPTQLDYARRITSDLRRLSQALRAQTGRPLRAIGIFGSDVRDKLILLRALRQENFCEVFFTTDLDNRLLDVSETPYTRNLLVVSGLGFRLPPPVQGDTPAFRDGYQGLLHLATLIALDKGGAFVDPPRVAEVETAWANLHPEAFEIGLSREVRLYSTVSIRVPPKSDDPATDVPSTQPSEDGWTDSASYQPDAVPWKITFWTAVLILFLFGSMRVISRRTSQRVMDQRGRRDLFWRLFWAAIFVVVAAISVRISEELYARPASEPDAEPKVLTQGVSAFPTIFASSAAVIISLAYLIRAAHAIKASNRRIEARYFAPQTARLAKRPPRFAGSDVARLTRLAGQMTGVSWAIAALSARAANPVLADKGKPHPRVAAPAVPPSRLRGIALWLWSLPVDLFYAPVRRKPDTVRCTTWDEWSSHRRASRFLIVALRSVLFTILTMMLFVLLCIVFGLPAVPIRGAEAYDTYVRLTSAATLMVVVLVYVTLDATTTCQVLTRRMAGHRAAWDECDLRHMAKRGVAPDYHRNLHNALAAWADVELIADRTEVVGKLTYAPFLVLAALVCSRLHLVDRWGWPASAAIPAVFLCVVSFLSARRLRMAAEAARTDALRHLAHERDKAIFAGDVAAVVKPIETLIEHVNGVRRGAFTPFGQRPELAPLLIPFSGAGLITLIEWVVAVSR